MYFYGEERMDLNGPLLAAYLGGMGGGKTLRLISIAEKLSRTRNAYKVFFPNNSRRAGLNEDKDAIVSRMGGPAVDAIVVDAAEPQELLDHVDRGTKVVLIDEAHMFSGLEGVLEVLLDKNKVIHVTSLTSDYGGVMFPIVRYMLPKAELVELHYGACMENGGCERDGIFSQAFVGRKLLPYSATENVKVGDVQGSEGELRYEPRCIQHFVLPPGAPGYQEPRKKK